MRTPLPIAVILLMVGVFAAGCSEKIEPGNTTSLKGPAVAVSVTTAVQTAQPVIYEAVGTVIAKVSATISSKLMGTIQGFEVSEGDLVKKGDLLVVLDDRQVSAQLNQAQAALEEAQKAETGAVSARQAAAAGAQQALLSYRRSQTLLAGEAITQEAFETVEARHGRPGRPVPGRSNGGGGRNPGCNRPGQREAVTVVPDGCQRWRHLTAR